MSFTTTREGCGAELDADAAGSIRIQHPDDGVIEGDRAIDGYLCGPCTPTGDEVRRFLQARRTPTPSTPKAHPR